ncbi:MAG: DUF3987 domain-containing protein [Thermoguttaceae bacterium]
MTTFEQGKEQLPDDLKKAACDYIAAGLSVVPTTLENKRASVAWKEFQTRIATEEDVKGWRGDSLAIVCGAVSGNLLCIDFDKEARLYDAWLDKIPPHLVEKFVIETTQRGGKHVVVRCEELIGGSTKLASAFEMNANGNNEQVTFIETRGERGYFLCAPSAGYTLTQGEFTALSILTATEVELLLDAARSFDATPSKTAKQPVTVSARMLSRTSATSTSTSPTEDFNERGREVVRTLLVEHGWTYCHMSGDGDNEEWRRPNKEEDGTSASLHTTQPLFYVFSTNAAPFEVQGYNFFQVYSILEHGCDESAAARQLLSDGYGENTSHAVTVNAPAPAYKPYPLDVLHPKEQEFVMEIAAAKNVAPDVVAITLDVVTSTLIGASHNVTAKSGWSEPVIVWVVVIADSGDGKTRVQSELLRPLVSIQEKWVQEHRNELDAYEIELERYKASRKKSTKNRAYAGFDAVLQIFCYELYEATGSATGVAGTTAAPAILNPDWGDILKVIDKYGKAEPRDVVRNGSRFRGEGGTDRAGIVLAEMSRAGIVTGKAEGTKLVYRKA